ncbi:hypothetical protein FOL47_009113 [Perkinsus chesapeaki]|uniref:Uncharacterized protein n=1 Tax=Perkinsus chesapeaki TaxID=330153 RepID=A0A7J6LB18_PERCH|nr:hypothetical protein FOL47_009113 [Perkinsus chesapeaki]
MSELQTYAASTISPVLSRALADLALQEPPIDTVAYLSNWLKLWAAAQEAESKRKEDAMKLIEHKERLSAEATQKQAGIALEKEKAARPMKLLAGVIDKVAGVDYREDCKHCEAYPSPSLWQELTDTLREAIVGCSGCYVGEVVTSEEGGKLIRYIVNSGTGPGQGELAEGDGVAWKVFEPVEVEEAGDGEENGQRSRQIYLPNVMDVDEVKYFTYAKPGAFIAVPISYTSVLNKEALEATMADLKERQDQFTEEMAAYQDAKAKHEEEVAGLEEGAEALEGPVEPVLRELTPLGGVQRQLVLCVDTLGAKGGLMEIPDEVREKLDELAGRLSDAMAATELQAIREQAEYNVSEEGRSGRKGVLERYREGSCGEEVEKAVAEAMEALGEDAAAPSDEEKEIIKLSCKFSVMRSVVSGDVKKDLLADIAARRLPEEALSVLIKAFLLFVAGQPSEALAADQPPWSELVTAINSDAVWESVLAVDLRLPRPNVAEEGSLARVKEMIRKAVESGGLRGEDGGAIGDDVAEAHPVDVILLEVLEAAVELREKDVTARWLVSDLRKKLFEPQGVPDAVEAGEVAEGEEPAGAGEETVEEGEEGQQQQQQQKVPVAEVRVDPSEVAAIDGDFVPLLEKDLAKLAEERGQGADETVEA